MKNRYLNTLLLGIIAVLIAIFVLGYFNIISLPQKKSVVTKQIDSTKETNQQNSNKEKQESKKNNELAIDETEVSLLTKNTKGETIPLGKSDLGTALDYEISPSGIKFPLKQNPRGEQLKQKFLSHILPMHHLPIIRKHNTLTLHDRLHMHRSSP